MLKYGKKVCETNGPIFSFINALACYQNSSLLLLLLLLVKANRTNDGEATAVICRLHFKRSSFFSLLLSSDWKSFRFRSSLDHWNSLRFSFCFYVSSKVSVVLSTLIYYYFASYARCCKSFNIIDKK